MHILLHIGLFSCSWISEMDVMTIWVFPLRQVSQSECGAEAEEEGWACVTRLQTSRPETKSAMVLINRTPEFPLKRAGCLLSRMGGKFSLQIFLLMLLRASQMEINVEPVLKKKMLLCDNGRSSWPPFLQQPTPAWQSTYSVCCQVI